MVGPSSEDAEQTIAIRDLAARDNINQAAVARRHRYQAAATAFIVLFWIVGISFWELPFFHDFMVDLFGWMRLTLVRVALLGALAALALPDRRRVA